ncbi:MAG: hypothetical protein PF485_11945 [Bacteroidales bacterium]|jgi:hypothetical protein|nr:hypothetical protein [Bacteroidales bacterium]
MYRIKYILILSLLISICACDNMDITTNQSKSFVKLIGPGNSNKGNDVKAFDNGYLILATTTPINREDTDISLIKTDKYGNQKGVADTINGGGNDFAGNILLSEDGGFFIVGTYEDTLNDNQDIYLAKYTSEGNFDWEKFIGTSANEQGTIIKKAQTGYVIAGSSDKADPGGTENPAGTKDVYLVKIDDEGNVEWDRNYGADQVDYASDVIMHNQGYLIVGSSNSFTEESGLGQFDILLIKTSFTGGETHKFTYGGIFNDYGNSVVETNDGYVFVGSVENINGDDANVYVSKVDKSNLLDVIWNKSFGTTLDDQGFDILKNENGFTVAGNSEISNGITAAYFLNIDTEGIELFENILGNYNQTVKSIERTSDGGYVMIGNSGPEGYEMICLMKLNFDGEL